MGEARQGTRQRRTADGVSGAGEPIHVVIGDDSYLIREGLQQLLAAAPEVSVVGTYADAPSLLAAIEAASPEVVLTDIRMPPTLTDEGMQIAERLRVSHPRVGVIVLSQHESVEYAAKLLESGAAGRGYLLKDRIHGLEHLVSTIAAVAEGECRIDPRLVDALMATRRRRPRSPLEELTPRQREILADVAEGKSNLGIARERGLTQRAVEKHVSEIFGRLGLIEDESISRRVRATPLYLAERGA